VKANITIMVWGGIWKGGRTDLVVMERDYQPPQKGGYSSWSYQQALQKGLLPVYDGTRHFQQDNAKIHKSKSTVDWLLRHGIELLEDWPAHSPDLNPIEHVWALLKRKMAKDYPDIWELKRNQLNIAEFTSCLQSTWRSLDQADIDRLIDSMPRRLAAVKKARGWYTKY
jgi:transposase